MSKHTMAIDQYGQTCHDLGSHPRKALMKRLGRAGARKMYVDLTAGGSAHVGYIIAGLWLKLYIVGEWRKPA